MNRWDPRTLAVLERLHRAGHRAVLVGGCVRDSLLSIPPHDYDAATSALPEQTKAACGDLECLDIGLKHGTITVLSGGIPVEVTTFRKETTYSDHRHPDMVEFTADLTEDLARRDFTINAMAWDAHDGLVDPFQGQDDLTNRLVRCVGDPDRRFEEDALRLLRGLRLAAQLDFAIHPDTAAAIHRHVPQLSFVAQERICAEFLRLICSPGAGRILLDFSDVVTKILPELAPAVDFDQYSPHHIYDVYAHSVMAMAAIPPTPVLRLAALLHDVGKPATFFLDEAGIGHFFGHEKPGTQLAQQALERLRADKATRERVSALVGRHHLPVEPTEAWAGRWLSRLGPDLFFDLLALKRADILACAPGGDGLAQLDTAENLARDILNRQPCLTLKDLAVNGRDCMAVGLTGPQIGQVLNRLLEQVAEGTLPNDRDMLLSRLAENVK